MYYRCQYSSLSCSRSWVFFFFFFFFFLFSFFVLLFCHYPPPVALCLFYSGDRMVISAAHLTVIGGHDLALPPACSPFCTCLVLCACGVRVRHRSV